MKNQFTTTTIFLGAIAISLVILGLPGAISAQSVQTVPVYRFFNGHSHFYSLSQTTGLSFDNQEGISYYVSPVPLPYTVPLYVLRKSSDTVYTISEGERKICLQNGYADRGVMGYILPADRDLPGTSPLHRWVGVHGGYQDHLYAATKPVVPGYTYEGEAARVWTEPVNLPRRLIELVSPVAGSTMQINSTPVFTWKVWSKGGSVRLSYSNDNGESWRPIATIPNNGVYGQLNNQSFNGWKVPPEAGGTIVIKADWIRGGLFGFAQDLPWATDSRKPIKVPAIGNIRLPTRTIQP